MRRTPPPRYVSRSIRLGRRWERRQTWIAVAGTDPWNVYAFEPGFLGEHARWWLKLQAKYQRWPWWRPLPPPRVSELVISETGPWDRGLGLLLAAWAVWRALRP